MWVSSCLVIGYWMFCCFSLPIILPPGVCRSPIPCSFYTLQYSQLPSVTSGLKSKLCHHLYLSSKSGNRESSPLGRLQAGLNITNKFHSFSIVRREETRNWAPSFWAAWGGGDGQRMQKCQEISYCFECGFFLIGCLISCYKSLTAFQSSRKIVLVSLWLFSWYFHWGNEGLRLSSLLFCWHYTIKYWIFLNVFCVLVEIIIWFFSFILSMLM